MLILGIESSCDETSVALVEDGRRCLSNLISSQVDLHKKFGGVVPELACRKHLEAINPLIEDALTQSGKSWKDIDAVAVTNGPGLVGALLVGVAAGKAISASLGVPLIGVNHLEGHILAHCLEDHGGVFPSVVLLVSGGHTTLYLAREIGDYQVLGETRDDAAGEAYDKVARQLGLGYPGGPIIDKIAKSGDPSKIRFPRGMMEKKDNFDFSFSGLKTAVVYYLRSDEGKSAKVEDVACAFQEAVVDVLVQKTIRAAKKYAIKTIQLAGGVARNSTLREKMATEGEKSKIRVLVPSPILCTDNAGMIASAGYYLYKRGKVSPLNLDAHPNLEVGR